MTRLDFTPLFRSTIGFDRMMNALETSARTGDEGYPLYNTEKVDENNYRITMEVPGLAESELSIEARDATVTIEGKPARDRHEGRTYLHQGIPTRGFKRAFQLASHVRVSGASLANGLLHIDLVREVPEALKPRSIEIRNGSAQKQLAA